MKYTLNKLKTKTTNNFKVNDITLDLEIPKFNKFKDYVITNNSKIKIKELLNNISNILISSINYSILKEKNEYSDIFDNILENDDINKLVNILSILDDEIYKLNFNVNLKLWLDSLFCKLIGDQL